MMHMSSTVRKTTKLFSSFTRSWSILSCLDASLVRIRRPRIVTTGDRRSRALLLRILLLRRPNHPAWTIFMALTRMPTGKLATPSLLVTEKSFGRCSTVTVARYWNGGRLEESSSFNGFRILLSPVHDWLYCFFLPPLVM